MTSADHMRSIALSGFLTATPTMMNTWADELDRQSDEIATLTAKADDWPVMRDQRDASRVGYQCLLEDTDTEIGSLRGEITTLTAEVGRLRAVFAYVVTIKDHTARQEAARHALEAPK